MGSTPRKLIVEFFSLPPLYSYPHSNRLCEMSITRTQRQIMIVAHLECVEGKEEEATVYIDFLLSKAQIRVVEGNVVPVPPAPVFRAFPSSSSSPVMPASPIVSSVPPTPTAPSASSAPSVPVVGGGQKQHTGYHLFYMAAKKELAKDPTVKKADHNAIISRMWKGGSVDQKAWNAAAAQERAGAVVSFQASVPSSPVPVPVPVADTATVPVVPENSTSPVGGGFVAPEASTPVSEGLSPSS